MKKTYYGWFVVLAGFFLMATGWGIVYNTASLFIVPISEHFGLLRSQVTFTMTLRSLVQLIMSLFAGRIFRRFSMIKSMKVMSLVLVVSYALFGFATNLWQIYLLTLIGAMAVSFVGVVPVSIIISNWFQEKIGFALGLASMGTGIGGMLFNSLSGRWILKYGWQRTYQIQALIIFIVIVPTVFFLIKEKPEDMGLEAFGVIGKKKPKQGLSLGQVKKLPYFWIIVIMTSIVNFTLSMSMITVAPHLVDIGYDFAFAANVLALSMASLAVGKIVIGRLLDKLGLRRAISIGVMGFIVTYMGLLYGQHRLVLIAVVVASGISCAQGTMVDPFLTRTIFGEKDYNSIYGILAAAQSLGGMFSPLVNGLSYDLFGNYRYMLLLMTGLSVGLLLVAQWLFSSKNIEKMKGQWALN